MNRTIRIRSLRSRLLALWLMLAASSVVTGLLLVEFYRQSTNALVGRADEAVARSCRELADRYQAFANGRSGANIDDALKQELAGVVQGALRQSSGVEGGIWQADAGSLGYAFPTYEGTGPKTDLPAAELSTIRRVNADALSAHRPVTVKLAGRSQVLVVHACPLRGPIADVTGWTMTRAFTAEGRAYNQLLIGLAIMALTVFGSAVWLARILYLWSRQLVRLEAELAGRDPSATELPALTRTGERELDRLVDALNAAGARLADERRRAGAAERLAAVGRLAAGLAHEIRNPIAAMRLKAENALAAGDDGRRVTALQSILQQVGRLDGLLRDLLAMTQRREPNLAEVDLAAFLERTIETHRELAVAKGVNLVIAPAPAATPFFDAEQMHRAVDNLILNAIESTACGDSIKVSAEHCAGKLRFRVRDTGQGVADDIRERLFEPFVTGRTGGTGLGLAVVREIARAHGGEARLVPTSTGAAFEIEVPWRTS
jgi:signal transduction histidine kinase